MRFEETRLPESDLLKKAFIISHRHKKDVLLRQLPESMYGTIYESADDYYQRLILGTVIAFMSPKFKLSHECAAAFMLEPASRQAHLEGQLPKHIAKMIKDASLINQLLCKMCGKNWTEQDAEQAMQKLEKPDNEALTWLSVFSLSALSDHARLSKDPKAKEAVTLFDLYAKAFVQQLEHLLRNSRHPRIKEAVHEALLH